VWAGYRRVVPSASLELSVEQARRVAVRAQLLDADRPADLPTLVRHLTLLQIDLTSADAPSADLVCWSRLGARYAPADLDALLDTRTLVEYAGTVRPAEDLALHRAEMSLWPGPGPLRDWQRSYAAWVAANDRCRRDILDALRIEGPLPARELPDTCVVPWRSSGWTNERTVQRLLDFMERRGEVAVSSRDGRERLWDLADRVYPDDPPVPLADALAERARRRLVALGIARPARAETQGEPNDVGAAGEPVTVAGVRGAWRVDPGQLARVDEPLRGRVALLSPLDRLVYDRKRMAELFAFDYQLEMYKPVQQRRWGYYALPVLVGERLVGKVDATADDRSGLLRLHALHEDEPFDAATRAAVEAEIADLAARLGLGLTDERVSSSR